MIEHISDYMRQIEGEMKGHNPSHIFLFRGEGRTDYKLLPSVYRRVKLGNTDAPQYLHRHTEKSILQEFMRDAAGYVSTVSIDDKFTWLEYAQHFGVPTRLMDWTANPLVALYFACCSSGENDGKVYILKKTMYMDLLRQPGRNKLGSMTIKEAVNRMIWSENEQGFLYPVPFVPYYVDKRMNAQSSYFLVWGNKPDPLDVMIEEMEQHGKARSKYCTEDENGQKIYSEKEANALTHIIIPQKAKNQLLHELDRFGINNASLFPGLDGVGKMIEWRNNKRNMLEFDFP